MSTTKLSHREVKGKNVEVEHSVSVLPSLPSTAGHITVLCTALLRTRNQWQAGQDSTAHDRELKLKTAGHGALSKCKTHQQRQFLRPFKLKKKINGIPRLL